MTCRMPRSCATGRSSWISGAVVADDTVTAVLSDSELLAAHRLELPWGFVVPAR